MFLTYLILALSLSIDSIGIGVTYGFRKTRIPIFSKLILFLVSVFFTSIALYFGKTLTHILPDFIATFVGSAILIIMGIWILIQIFNNDITFDIDNSKVIDYKEAIFLGIALSIDSVSVSIGGGISGLDSIWFPILISVFQILFLFIGEYLGNHLNGIKKIPENICNMVSGVLLILIGVSRLFV